MSEMGKLAEKLKRGRRKAEREGKALPDLWSNMASNRGGSAICCSVFANKEHGVY